MYSRQHARRPAPTGNSSSGTAGRVEHGGDDELERRQRLEHRSGAAARGRHGLHVLADADALAVEHRLAHERLELIPALGRHDLPQGGRWPSTIVSNGPRSAASGASGPSSRCPMRASVASADVEDRAQLLVQAAHGRLAQHADAQRARILGAGGDEGAVVRRRDVGVARLGARPSPRA